MGHVTYIDCDRAGCTNRQSDNRGLSLSVMVEAYGWKTEGGGLICPSCQNGRSEEEMRLIQGGKLMLEGVKEFDNGADCYLDPCRDSAHDNCLLHIFADGDEEAEGPYVRIISSGCGSYHAQIVSADGAVVVPDDDEVWWE